MLRHTLQEKETLLDAKEREFATEVGELQAQNEEQARGLEELERVQQQAVAELERRCSERCEGERMGAVGGGRGGIDGGRAEGAIVDVSWLEDTGYATWSLVRGEIKVGFVAKNDFGPAFLFHRRGSSGWGCGRFRGVAVAA